MDMNFLMMNQLSGMPIGNSADLQIANPSGVEEGFGDLLGMVEGLETAELSSAVDAEGNWAKLMGEMGDESERVLGREKDMALSSLQIGAQLNAGMLQKSFGQENASVNLQANVLPENLSEVNTKSFSEFQRASLNGVTLNGVTTALDGIQSQTQMSLAQKQMPLSQESVAAWTAALSAGELKSVEVGEAPVVTQLPSEKVEMGRIEMQSRMGLDLGEAPLKNGVSDEVLEKSETSTLAKAGVDLSAKSGNKVSSQEALTSNAVKSNAGESSADMSSNTKSQSNGFELDPQVKKLSQKAEPQNARDFMLDRSSYAVGATAGARESSALKTSLEGKIDSKVVDFVADKVEQLQSTGGGTLKLGLDTKDQGSIEIRVTLRGGQVDVKIEGSNESLTRELHAHRADLKTRLEKTVDVANIDIGNRKAVDLSSVRMGATQLASSVLSSDEMVRSLTGSDIARLNDGGANILRNADRNANNLSVHSGEQSAAASDDSSGFSHEDRRQQAMNQWAGFSEKMKKSA